MSKPKAQPHDPEAERAVIGAMMLNADTVPIARQEIGPDVFYNMQNRHMFNAICDAFDNKGTVDSIVVKNELQGQGLWQDIGGLSGYAEYTETTQLSENIEHYCDIVERYHQRRKLKETARKLKQGAESQDIEDVVSEARNDLAQITGQATDHDVTLHEAWQEAKEQMRRKATGEEPSIDFGIPAIDSGLELELGDLFVISGESGAGKSSLAYRLLWQASKNDGLKSHLYSAEISHADMSRRMMCQVAGVNTRNAKAGRITKEEKQRMDQMFDDYNTKSCNLTINGKIARVDKLVSDALGKGQCGGVDIICIDHAQELWMHKGRENLRKAEYVADAAKRITRQTGALVVLLSQVTNLDNGGWRLRGGDELRNKADQILIVLTPDDVVFGDTADDDETHRDIIVAKGRDAGQGKTQVPFYGPHLRFGDISY